MNISIKVLIFFDNDIITLSYDIMTLYPSPSGQKENCEDKGDKAKSNERTREDTGSFRRVNSGHATDRPHD